MGHKLTDKGVEPDPAKVAAVTEMLTPTDKYGVQRFLGMCQYLSKFCHNLSEIRNSSSIEGLDQGGFCISVVKQS